MSKPDGYLPDGTPVYLLKLARGNGKTRLQFRIYAKLFGLSDEEIDELERQAEENLGLASDEDDA